MRKIEIKKGNLHVKERIAGFIEKRVTPFGTGAKVDCPREHLGKRVYLIICQD